MTDLEAIYAAEPRLASVEALVDAIHRRDGVVPWEHVHRLFQTFVGIRRDASVVAPRTGLVEQALPSLRNQAVLAEVGHRLRDRASVDDGHLSGR